MPESRARRGLQLVDALNPLPCQRHAQLRNAGNVFWKRHVARIEHTKSTRSRGAHRLDDPSDNLCAVGKLDHNTGLHVVHDQCEAVGTTDLFQAPRDLQSKCVFHWMPFRFVRHTACSDGKSSLHVPAGDRTTMDTGCFNASPTIPSQTRSTRTTILSIDSISRPPAITVTCVSERISVISW